MRSIVFELNSWSDYEMIRETDKKLHKKLLGSIKEIRRGDPTTGAGKPEQLRGNLSGLWSRRLSKKDRLIYKWDDQYVYIFAIGGHYDQL